jgi:AcrR family transcriptional regulator
MAERSTSAAGSIRARVRAEMIEEIKAVARRHVAAEGAALSLRAVARDMGMVSSALYRYFASRDELLTALILDAYNSMGEAAETADVAIADRSDLLGRWLAVARALRAWSLERPHEYALIYGSPVPGYAAPEDTIGPATRPVLVLGAILADAHTSGRLSTVDDLPARLPARLRDEVRGVAGLVAPGVPAPIMARGLIAWTELFGAISFELFGRIDNVIDERDDWYDHQARAMAHFIGLA